MTHNTTIDYGNSNTFGAILTISLTYFAKKAAAISSQQYINVSEQTKDSIAKI
ncbi:hypothetical protein SFB21_0912 [Acinetobacter bouvetii]|uniref:Uncharacterized protein n=1 Tax=Acinetobacter bouvetii TaxID=202951 RepID=A0A811GCV2_9GAMM|nr:hypothetical protein SFB21_0912 [Acinetobacter bouvetii]